MKHGGDLAEAASRHGGDPEDWLDLSTGINPNPWPVPAGLAGRGWTRLPDRAARDALLLAARDAYGVPAAAGIVAAPGTQSLIQWLPRLAPPGKVAVVGPTYDEHAASWRDAGFRVQEVGWLDEAAAAHLVVVNPNNPDGRVFSRQALSDAALRCRDRGGWLVVDESFADVEPGCSVAGDVGELPVLVLRSFGKFYGLAGLRLGFAVAPPALAATIERAVGPWAVSGPALAIGAAALRDRAWARAARERLAEESRALDALLLAAGLSVVGGTALFRLTRHGAAQGLHERLARHRIWVRRFARDPGLLRFGLPPDAAGLTRLAAALAGAAGSHDQGTSTGAPSCSAR